MIETKNGTRQANGWMVDTHPHDSARDLFVSSSDAVAYDATGVVFATREAAVAFAQSYEDAQGLREVWWCEGVDGDVVYYGDPVPL